MASTKKERKKKKNEKRKLKSELKSKKVSKLTAKQLDNESDNQSFNQISAQSKTKELLSDMIDYRLQFENDFTRTLADSSEINDLLKIANSRLDILYVSGNNSRALERLWDENALDAEGYFEISKDMSSEEILAKLQQIKVFLNDFTSTRTGAEWWDSESRFAESLPFFTYNKLNGFNEKDLSNAFKIYRIIEEDLGSEIIREYGSDKLINYLYNSIPYDAELDESDRIELYNEAIQRIDSLLSIKYGEFQKTFSRENEVDFIVDYFEDVKKEFEKDASSHRVTLWDYL